MKTSTKVTVAAIALTALMVLLTITVIALAVLSQNRDSTQEAEEIIFEPEVVSLDEGTISLDVAYSTEDTFGFESSGTDEIPLSIIPDEDNPNQYLVKGFLTSTQLIQMSALDQGRLCTYKIQHTVVYDVSGTFYPASCQFDIDVALTPTSSQLLSHDCSMDIAIDFSPLYMAPLPGTLVFTRALETMSVSEWKYFLFNVNFPARVNCPAFVK